MFGRKHESGFIIDTEQFDNEFNPEKQVPSPPKSSKPKDYEFIPKSSVAKVMCIFFVYVGLVPMEVGRKIVWAYKKDFEYRKMKYIIDCNKITQIKPWHFRFTRNYFNFSFYKVGNALPLSIYKPSFVLDADALDRVTNDQNIRTLLPSPNKMLYLVTLLALVVGMAAMGLSAYLLADPEGTEKIRSLVTNENPNKPPVTPGIPTQGSNPPPPVVINPK